MNLYQNSKKATNFTEKRAILPILAILVSKTVNTSLKM